MRLTNYKTLMFPLLLALLLSSCGPFGEVEQGLVITFDEPAGEITLILDSNYDDPDNPRYDRLPPVTINIPRDSSQMGPAPAAGKLIEFDSEAGQAVVFDASSGSLRSVSFQVVSQTDGVYADDSRVAGESLPVIDASAGTITLYSARTHQLATISVSEDVLALPPDSWISGDEIRYYFKEPAQALRLMNVTQTGIS